jgi:hypothetical protein
MRIFYILLFVVGLSFLHLLVRENPHLRHVPRDAEVPRALSRALEAPSPKALVDLEIETPAPKAVETETPAPKAVADLEIEPPSPLAIVPPSVVRVSPEIPKIIHQFWTGSKPKPSGFMRDCRELHATYEYKLWTQDNLFPLENQKLYDCGSNNFKSDIVRYEVLKRYGGFYLDADTFCKRSLEPLRSKPFVAGYHHYHNPSLKGNHRYENKLVASAVIGSAKGGAIISRLVADLRNNTRLCGRPAWSSVGPLYLTNTLKSMNFSDILPFSAFVPYHYKEKRVHNYTKMSKYNSFAANLWGTTLGWAPLSEKIPCDKYRRRMTSKILSIYTEIMAGWEKTAKTQKIDYTIAYGTALGYKRHQGFIPWDDDIDLLILENTSSTLRASLEKPLCTSKFWGGFKVYKCDSPKAGKYPWGYPFMDVFFETGRRNRENSKPEIMFPSVPILMDGIPIRAPKNLDLHLDLKFKAADQCKSPSWDHRRESGLKRVAYPCKDVMQKCYPHRGS